MRLSIVFLAVILFSGCTDVELSKKSALETINKLDPDAEAITCNYQEPSGTPSCEFYSPTRHSIYTVYCENTYCRIYPNVDRTGD